MEPLTEVDLFLSDRPLSLIQDWSPAQLQVQFGEVTEVNDPQFKQQLLDQIWTKYHRIDLIKWDPQDAGLFFDYVQQKPLSLTQFEENLRKYPPLARKRVRIQLERSLPRWQSDSTNSQLVQRIQNVVDQIAQMESQILSSEYVSDPNF